MKKICLFFFMVFSFSGLLYGQMTWTTPVTLSGTGASSPQIVADANANATAAWMESGIVKSSSLPFGGSWSSATTLSSTGSSNPVIVVDSSGNVTALWLQSGVIMSASLPFGGSWGSAVSVSSSGASTPAMAVDTSGNVVGVWIRNGFVETATQLSGMSWGIVSMLSGASSTNPKIAIGGGLAAVSWTTVVSGTSVIQAATGTVGGSWNSAQTLSQAIFDNDYSRIAVDSNGNVIALWYQYDFDTVNYSNVNVVSAALGTSSGMTTWDPPVVLSLNGQKNPALLKARIGFDGQGNALAFWSNCYDEQTFAIEAVIRPVGATWGGVSQLDAQDLFAFQGDVSNNSFGDAVAVYMSYDNVSSVNIVSTESDIGGVTENFWSPTVIVSTGADNGYPRVASTLLSGVINGFAVWITSDGVNNTIAASTGARTLLLPPTSPSVVQSSVNYGVFTNYYNTISWTLSTDPNTIEYIIFRNNIFLGQVGSSSAQFVDNNQIQNGSVIYSIVGFDMFRAQSTAATVSFP